MPTSPPSIVITYNTSSTSIFVEWSPPPIDSIRGVLLGYEVSYTPAVLNTSHNASKTRRIMLCDCNTSVELKTLRIYTLYNITVAAFTKVGIGNESDIKQTRTDEEGLFWIICSSQCSQFSCNCYSRRSLGILTRLPIFVKMTQYHCLSLRNLMTRILKMKWRFWRLFPAIGSRVCF